MGLSQEEIDALLNKTRGRSAAPKPPQGPLKAPPQTSNFVRVYDLIAGLRCASRGCSSPTCYKLKGVPYCSVHLIQLLADMLDEQVNHYPNRPPWIEKYMKGYMEYGDSGSNYNTTNATT